LERKKLDEIIAHNEQKEAELRQLEQKLAKQELDHVKYIVEDFHKAATKEVLLPFSSCIFNPEDIKTGKAKTCGC
jgi:prefoldin subunit 5